MNDKIVVSDYLTEDERSELYRHIVLQQILPQTLRSAEDLERLQRQQRELNYQIPICLLLDLQQEGWDSLALLYAVSSKRDQAKMREEIAPIFEAWSRIAERNRQLALEEIRRRERLSNGKAH
jgi:hypothetical protein